MIALKKKTILLVEDEAVIITIEKKSLEVLGYNVITANTGEKAVDVFKNNKKIDLILMDIDLGSGIDGTETALRILNERTVPVIFLSSHTEPRIVERTEKITSYGYVVKNSGITVLDASIKMAFKLFDSYESIQTQKMDIEMGNEELNATIEELILSRKEINEARHMLQLVLDTIPVRVSWKDLSSKYKGCNRAFAVDAGRTSPEDIINMNDNDMVWGGYADLYRADDQKVIKSRLPRLNYEEERPASDGGIMSLLASKIPLRNAEGRVDGVLETYQDITGIKRMEMTFEMVFRLAPVAIGITRLDNGRIIQANDYYSRIMGYTAEEVIGRTTVELNFWINEDDRERVRRLLVRDGYYYNLDLNFRRKNGDVFIARQSGSLVKFGDTEYIIGISQDISNIKKIEEELMNAEEDYKALNHEFQKEIFRRRQAEEKIQVLLQDKEFLLREIEAKK